MKQLILVLSFLPLFAFSQTQTTFPDSIWFCPGDSLIVNLNDYRDSNADSTWINLIPYTDSILSVAIDDAVTIDVFTNGIQTSKTVVIAERELPVIHSLSAIADQCCIVDFEIAVKASHVDSVHVWIDKPTLHNNSTDDTLTVLPSQMNKYTLYLHVHPIYHLFKDEWAMFDWKNPNYTLMAKGYNVCSTTQPKVAKEVLVVVGVDELKKSMVKVGPNPTSDYINVAFDTPPTHEVKIEITTVTGQLIKKQNVTSVNNNITIQELPSGTYFLNITSQNKNYNQSITLIKN